jgi:hypothetical protein
MEEEDGFDLGISDGDWDDYIEPYPDDWSSYKNELDEQEFEKNAVRRRSLKLEKLLRQDEKKRIARVKKRAMNYIGEIDVVEPDLEIGQICRVVLPDHTPPAMSRVRIHKVIILNEPDKIGLVKVAQVHAWELENTPRDLMCLVFMVEQGSNLVPMSVAEMQGIIRDIDSALAQNLRFVDPNNLNIMLTSDGKIYAPYSASGDQTPQGSLEITFYCEELGPMLGQ